MRLHPGRRGQMEMIGLVFVVLIIVVGIVLYLSFSGEDANEAQRSKQSQAYFSYITAFGETNIPSCGMSTASVAEACLLDDRSVCQGDPCEALDTAMETVAQKTLDVQGLHYNFSLEGTDVGDENGCPSASRPSGLRWASLPVGGAAGNSALRLSVCSR